MAVVAAEEVVAVAEVVDALVVEEAGTEVEDTAEVSRPSRPLEVSRSDFIVF